MAVDDFPIHDDRDAPYRVARASIAASAGLFPVVGAIVAPAVLEVIDGAIGQPLMQRQAQWLQRLGERVAELEKLGKLRSTELGQDPYFISVVAHATDIARRNHHKEKLSALENIVINTACGSKLNDVLTGSFLNYIDRFSALHLSVIRVLSDPQSNDLLLERFANNYRTGGILTIISATHPDIESDDILKEVYMDLERERLVEGSLGMTMSASGLLSKRATKSGDAFVKFFSSYYKD